MLYICSACTTAYAPADRCPHCLASDHYLDDGDETVPKNTNAGGASNALTDPAPEAVEPEAVEAEAEAPSVSVNAAPAEASGGATGVGEPAPEPEPEPDPALAEAPAEGAPKAEWVAFVVEVCGLSAEDASGMTKAELIDMVRSL